MTATGMLGWTAGLPEFDVPAGAVLIREGEEHRAMLVLVDGALEVSRDGTQVAVIADPGAVFGEMAVLLGSAATATVRALADSRLRRCEDPMGFLTGQPGAALDVATTLARRLATITGYLVDLRQQYADRGDQLAMVHTVLETLTHHQGRTAEPGSEREAEAPY